MTSSLRAGWLAAAAAALALALPSAAAYAGDVEDLIAARQASALVDAAAESDDVLSDAVEAAASEAAAETLLGAIADALEE